MNGYMVGSLLGTILGATIAISILTLIVEKIAFKLRPPALRAQMTVGTSLVIAAIIAGFGKADGGSFVWTAGLFYLPGAVLVFIWRYAAYNKLWSEN